jgi:hypothetical protein
LIRAHFGQEANMKNPKQLAWQGVAIVSGTLAATAVRRVAVTTWRTTKHEDPPENPVARDVSWPDALVWTIAVAVGAAVARLVAQRGAAVVWERATGEPIPVPADAS